MSRFAPEQKRHRGKEKRRGTTGEPENHSREGSSRGGRRPGVEEGRTEEEAAGSRGGRR
jgi:hypothetical protein